MAAETSEAGAPVCRTISSIATGAAERRARIWSLRSVGASSVSSCAGVRARVGDGRARKSGMSNSGAAMARITSSAFSTSVAPCLIRSLVPRERGSSGEAGTAIADIVGNAARIDSLMREIANATQEQSLGVNQVGAAVHDLDQNTQQNAALVEETAAAATALSEQAERLAQVVSFFKLK